jgi:hypothetical protein
MMYAINAGGERIAPERQQDALCPGCRQPVIARCGDINVHHWAHVSGCECDPWHEPETQWHIKWKMQFEEQSREVVLPPHRADICATRVDTDRQARTVIELQHSPIEPAEIKERENFYFAACSDMRWVIDAREITENFEFENTDTLNGGATIRANVKWRWFRRSWGTIHVAPRYLDFGDELWRIEDINGDGRGRFRSFSYHEFLSDFEEARGYNLPVKWRPTSTGGFVYRFGRGNVLLFRNKTGRYQFRTTWDGGEHKIRPRTYGNPDEAKEACEPHLATLMTDRMH